MSALIIRCDKCCAIVEPTGIDLMHAVGGRCPSCAESEEDWAKNAGRQLLVAYPDEPPSRCDSEMFLEPGHGVRCELALHGKEQPHRITWQGPVAAETDATRVAGLKTRIRERLAVRSGHAEALEEALTVWCGWCWTLHFGPRPPDTQPAVLRLSWSDRESFVCARHLPDALVNIALDHSYDRHEIAPYVDGVEQHPLLKISTQAVPDAAIEAGCAAARAFLDALDRARPDWRDKTVDLDNSERAALLECVTLAVDTHKSLEINGL